MATITKPCRRCGQLFEARNDPSKQTHFPENLVVMTRSEHMKLHAQMRLAEKGRAV